MNKFYYLEPKSLALIDNSIKSAINWYAFFMAFPVILLFNQNISIFLFIFLVIRLSSKTSLFKIRFTIQYLALMFLFGAVVSVLDANSSLTYFDNEGINVLPNYIYWILMFVLIVNIRSIVDIYSISKYLLYGLVSTVVFYLFQHLIQGAGLIFNKLTPNSFSLILICFSTPCFVYLYQIRKKKIIAVCFLLIAIYFLIIDGRRAGTLLVFLPSLLSLIFNRIEVRKMGISFVVFTLIFLILQMSGSEKVVYSLNPRIHGLIYESDNIMSEDRSYLVRRLQVEKAMIIFNEHPITGVGLNSFAKYGVMLKGDFVGGEYVITKVAMDKKSAHNSYISILAEGGLLLLVPLLLIILYNLVHFVRSYNRRNQMENSFYWSFIAMSIHLYFITGIVNIFVWFLISLVSAISVKYSFTKSLN